MHSACDLYARRLCALIMWYVHFVHPTFTLCKRQPNFYVNMKLFPNSIEQFLRKYLKYYSSQQLALNTHKSTVLNTYKSTQILFLSYYCKHFEIKRFHRRYFTRIFISWFFFHIFFFTELRTVSTYYMFKHTETKQKKTNSTVQFRFCRYHSNFSSKKTFEDLKYFQKRYGKCTI